MEMNLEQAIQYASEYQRQVEEGAEQLAIAEREFGRSSRQWRLCRTRLSDAKIMLEWYQGYEDTDSHGNKFRVGGLIQKMMNEAQRLKEQSNLGERFLNRTFGNFETRRDPSAYQQCLVYSERESLFKDKRNGLLIFGGIGSGKTHLACAIANAMIERGIPALFATFSEHLEHIREEFDHTGQKKYLSMLKNTPIVVLDDLGKERKSEWTQQILFDIVNYRYEHMLPIIITSNFDVDGMANYVGGAVWSRLYEMCSAVETKGKDYRQK